MIKPYFQDSYPTIYHGDALEVLPQLSGASAIVTDPPYELGFMGKSWDSKGVSFQPETWKVIRNACLPGAPILAFGGTRTQHRIACAIEDAGWTLRDVIMWVYGSGFPKSLDIGKAIDKSKGVEREDKFEGVFERHAGPTGNKRCDVCGKWLVSGNPCRCPRPQDTPQTPEAQLWDGYGTGLKPAYEPIILAMNPLDGTFANNALQHGVAGINVDGCRVPTEDNSFHRPVNFTNIHEGYERPWKHTKCGEARNRLSRDISEDKANTKGRFPANFIHDGSQQVMELFPKTKSGQLKEGHKQGAGSFGKIGGDFITGTYGGDSGSAARFFYCAKASKSERGEGNDHPTVKPLALMEYLCKLVMMPEYNLIIDPFMGSGTTLLACISLGIPCIGIDSDEKSCEIAANRCRQMVMELKV